MILVMLDTMFVFFSSTDLFTAISLKMNNTLSSCKNRESNMHRVKMARSSSTRKLAQQMDGISKLAKVFAIAQITEEQIISLKAYMRN